MSKGADIAGAAGGGAEDVPLAGLALCAHADNPHRSSTRAAIHEHRFVPLPILIILSP
jgi:hypothetical protein